MSKRGFFTTVATLMAAIVLGGTSVAAELPASPDGATVRGSKPEPAATHTFPVAGNPETALAKYEQWKATVEGAEPVLTLALRWSRGLSDGARSPMAGVASIDLRTGEITVDLDGVADTAPLDVWVVDNTAGAGKTALPEQGDRMVRVGALTRDGDTAALARALAPQEAEGLEVDLVVVTPAGKRPDQGGTLFGIPTLFQKLYVAELRAQQAQATSGPGAGASTLVVTVAAPGDTFAEPPAQTLQTLVEEGEQIFFNETFLGNGRVCGSCHPADNNYTLDPDYIAQLKINSPGDPLFVADPSSPAFFGALEHNFENPQLMESHALILQNPDGFDDLDNNFVMRGVPHLFGLSRSTDRAFSGDPTISPPIDRLGWGGDGSPTENCGQGGPCGAIEEFALGAVRQHLTRTLKRVPCTLGPPPQTSCDFRYPDTEELLRLSAFMLSLGRAGTFDLDNFFVSDPLARQGENFFVDYTSFNACNACHDGGGANHADTGSNHNFALGTEAFLQSSQTPAEQADRPIDGGFGTGPCVLQSQGECFPDPPVANANGGYGNFTFNTPSVIEAADTGPFFHNHAGNVDDTSEPGGTLEDAVFFYATPLFGNGFSDPSFKFDDLGGPQAFCNAMMLDCCTTTADFPRLTQSTARFLRVLNSIDNIETQIVPFIESGIANMGPGVAPVLELAIANIDDTLEVLQQQQTCCTAGPGGDPTLHPDTTAKLELARSQVDNALTHPFAPPAHRISLLQQALGNLCTGYGCMIDPVPAQCSWGSVPDAQFCRDTQVEDLDACDYGPGCDLATGLGTFVDPLEYRNLCCLFESFPWCGNPGYCPLNECD